MTCSGSRRCAKTSWASVSVTWGPAPRSWPLWRPTSDQVRGLWGFSLMMTHQHVDRPFVWKLVEHGCITTNYYVNDRRLAVGPLMYSELLIGCFHTDCEHQAAETATHIFFISRSIFLNVPTANKRINHSPGLNGMGFMYMNKNGWQANYLCLWAPSLVRQRTSKLTCTNCLTDVLKYIQNRP